MRSRIRSSPARSASVTGSKSPAPALLMTAVELRTCGRIAPPASATTRTAKSTNSSSCVTSRSDRAETHDALAVGRLLQPPELREILDVRERFGEREHAMNAVELAAEEHGREILCRLRLD